MITSEKGGPDPQDSPLPKNRISLVYTYYIIYYNTYIIGTANFDAKWRMKCQKSLTEKKQKSQKPSIISVVKIRDLRVPRQFYTALL